MKNKKRGFTLSEVIITLVVLGIVAAITVPMMSSNAHDKKWNVARQKAKATIGEAFRLMTVNGEISTKNSDGTDRTTEYMVTKVLPKYLKLEKTCAPGDFKNCGFPETVKTANGPVVSGLAPSGYKWSTLLSQPGIIDIAANNNNVIQYSTGKFAAYNTNYFFRTLDGYSVAFLYNPYCSVDDKQGCHGYYSNVKLCQQPVLNIVCLMGIYDMNGKRGPNRVGQDIGFVGSFYNGYSVQMEAMLPHEKELSISSINNGESLKLNKVYKYCDTLGGNNDWILPSIWDGYLLLANNKLINGGPLPGYPEYLYRTIYPYKDNYIYHTYANTSSGYTGSNCRPRNTTDGTHVRCVRRTQLK